MINQTTKPSQREDRKWVIGKEQWDNRTHGNETK